MRIELTQLMQRANQRLSLSLMFIGMVITGCNNRTVVVKPEESGILPPSNPPAVAVETMQPEVMLAGRDPWWNTQSSSVTKWYTQYQNEKCIGFSEFNIATSETQGSSLLNLTKHDVLEVAATANRPIQRREIVLKTLEDAGGALKRYTETSSVGDSIAQTEASVENSILIINKTIDGKPTPTKLPWSTETWGPLGVIAILQHQPMGPNEFREAKMFVPPLEKIVKVQLRSKKWEPTPLPGGIVKELLLIETLFINDEDISMTKNWVNDTGEIIKSVSPSGFAMFQTTREEAERIDSSILAAQLLDSKIPVQATVEQLRAASVAFSIESTNVDPFGLLSSKVNQRVQSLSAFRAMLTVDRAIPSDPIPEGVQQDPPKESDLSKFKLDAIQLETFLSELPNDSEGSIATASKLTEMVYRKLEKAPLSRQFATPARTIQQRQGDCKAHAVLLVATLRELGIPARAASGLRIVTDKEGDQLFAIYHMWCEAWVGDRWIPLDPFAGSIGVGADHIKFSESSLDESNPLTAMLNVLRNLNQLTIEIKP